MFSAAMRRAVVVGDRDQAVVERAVEPRAEQAVDLAVAVLLDDVDAVVAVDEAATSAATGRARRRQ